MNTKRMCVTAFGAVALLLPAVLVAQMDPNANQGPGSYSQPGMNQPNGQPGTPGMNPQAGQPNSMRDSLGAPGQTGQQMMDQQFVREAVAGGTADVKLGDLAVEKGSPAVKELAQKMVDDHAAMDKDLLTVADSMGVTVPKKMDKDGQKEYEKLNGLSGKDFDTEYVTYTAKTHFWDLHKYHMEASSAASPELSAEVVKAMHMMHQHLGMIASTAKDEGIALPPRPVRPASVTASK